MKQKLNVFKRGMRIYALLITLLCIFPNGCAVAPSEKANLRIMSPYFGSNINYLHPEKLGKHSYGGNFSEKIGMLYTCKAGYIDMGHLRESVDRTKYISEIVFDNIMKKEIEFSFNVIEPARYFVKVKYPENWDSLNEAEKEKIAREISIGLGQYIAFASIVWHEIITYFGYSCVGVFSEKPSSFSWEDCYSDLLGTKLSAQALQENNDFNISVTKLIDLELKKLDVQQPEIAKQATKKIKGKWFKGECYPFIQMKKRNFDVGLDGGYLTPWLVPGICKNENPELCRVPDLKSISKYGFSFKIEIEPREAQKNRILDIIHADKGNIHDKKIRRIQPDEDYKKIIDYIKDDAIKEEGSDVDKPIL